MERFKKIKTLALFVLALGFCLTSWSQTAVPEARAIALTKYTIDGSFDGATSVYAADVDNDGDMDVLGAVYWSGDIVWWENDGSENFTKHIIDGSFSGALSVYAADVDNDGDIDILGAANYAGNMAWWENDGSENFTKHTIDGSFSGAASVYAADVDNDGDMDVLGAARAVQEIVWWENDLIVIDTTPPTLTTEAYIPDNDPMTGTFIDNGDVVNLDDIDEAGEKVTIYSDAFDTSGIIQDQKIKWFRYDADGNLIDKYSNYAEDTYHWDTTTTPIAGGLNSLTITGPLNDGDRIEYQSEATDTASNTAYHPTGSDACIATDPNPCAARYSFTVISASVTLSANPPSGSAPLSSVLTATVTGSATGPISYKFDCGDGGGWGPVIAVNTATCNYTTAGTYTARVEVTRQGITATDTVDIIVNPPNNPPTALFNAVVK